MRTELLSVSAAAVLLASVASAAVQTTYVEVEPNNSKAAAVVVPCLVAGDALTGTSAGTSTAPGDASTLSADYYRIQTCALPPALYRHRLTITTSGTAGHSGSILGRDVVDLPPPTILTNEVLLQSTTPTSTPPRFSQWYGFGRSEQLYYRVTGVSGTTAPYVATLTTDLVPIVAIPQVFLSGPITITTEGQGHGTDTEIHVYDAGFQPIAGFKNDDTPLALPGGGVGFQSTLQRTFAPGTYYVLIAAYNLTDNLLSGADDDFGAGDVLDFPDAVLSSSTTGGSNVSFAVSDVVGTTAVGAALPPTPYEILWYQLTVGPAWSISSYCFGDASGPGCPCANNGIVGRGCANSTNGFGALLVGTGVPSVSADTFVLQGSGMPATSSVLYFQGTTAIQTAFGDGFRCAGGTVVRLGPKTNAGGASQYPSGLDVAIATKGGATPAATLRYQAWYRDSAVFCTSAVFNLTNGVTATWGP